MKWKKALTFGVVLVVGFSVTVDARKKIARTLHESEVIPDSTLAYYRLAKKHSNLEKEWPFMRIDPKNLRERILEIKAVKSFKAGQGKKPSNWTGTGKDTIMELDIFGNEPPLAFRVETIKQSHSAIYGEDFYISGTTVDRGLFLSLSFSGGGLIGSLTYENGSWLEILGYSGGVIRTVLHATPTHPIDPSMDQIQKLRMRRKDGVQ